MATILQFRAEASEMRRPKSRRRRAPAAEIVIFPGVRYERWADPEKPSERATGKTTARDVLKIVD